MLGLTLPRDTESVLGRVWQDFISQFLGFFVPAQTGCICNPVASACLSGFLALLGLYCELTAEPGKKQTPAGKREMRNFTEFTLVMKVGFVFFSKQSEKQLFRNILLVFLN